MRTGYLEGRAEDQPTPVGAHAIVIGAGIAGLTAARVLAERFDRVTIVDRDTLPVACVDRAGIPQGLHGHGLLASGLQALTRLFPGVDADLTAAGAVGGDVIGDIRWFQHWTLQDAIRQRPTRLPDEPRAARRGDPCASQAAVECRDCGWTSRDRAPHGSCRDADHQNPDIAGPRRGRNRRPGDRCLWPGIPDPTWLPALGFGSPRAERIDIELFYATRQFVRRSTDLAGDSAAIIAATRRREPAWGSC